MSTLSTTFPKRLAEITHRLDQIVAFLIGYRNNKDSALVAPLWSIRAVQDESRALGERDIYDVCQQIESQLILLQSRNVSNADDTIIDLSKSLELIRERLLCISPGMDSPAGDQVIECVWNRAI